MNYFAEYNRQSFDLQTLVYPGAGVVGFIQSVFYHSIEHNLIFKLKISFKDIFYILHPIFFGGKRLQTALT